MFATRLSTVNKIFARRFQHASDVDEARQFFEQIFLACARRIESSWFSLLGNDDLALRLTAGELPQGYNFDALSAEMDRRYLDAEDGGRARDSAAYFTLARLMSSLSLAATSNDVAAFSEAAYEAVMALPDPAVDSLALV
jgi:hypothetical protein